MPKLVIVEGKNVEKENIERKTRINKNVGETLY